MDKGCNFCGNKNFRKKDVQYIYKHDGRYLIVDNVPSEECEYCGERYFAAKTLKKIEADFNEIYTSGKEPKKKIQVPIEEFMSLESV